MWKKRLTILSALLIVLLLPAVAGAAAPWQSDPGEEVINHDLTLTSDYDIDSHTVVNGDVVVVDGELDLDGTVNGDVTLLGGELDFSGTITGELVVVGGHLTLAEGVSVGGDCIVIGGELNDNGVELGCTSVLPGALGQSIINGLSAALPELVPEVKFIIPEVPQIPEIPEIPGNIEIPETPGLNQGGEARPDSVPPVPEIVSTGSNNEPSFAARLFGAIGRALFFGFLAFVVAAIFPARLAEISDAVAQKPVAAGTIGLLTAIAAVSLLVLTSIIWVPLLLVLSLLCGLGILLGIAGFTFMGGSVVFGWTAVGALVGEWVARRFNINKPSYAALAALGTAVMTLVIGLLGLIPFTPEGLLGIAIVSAGLGGVVLTRYGRQPYPLVSTPVIDSIKIQNAINNMPEDFS